GSTTSALAGSAIDTTPRRFTGVVEDAGGSPLSGLCVLLLDPQTQASVGGADTDTAGGFRFAVAPGIYTLDIGCGNLFGSPSFLATGVDMTHGDVTGLTMRLPRLVTMTVHASDSAGNAVADAAVYEHTTSFNCPLTDAPSGMPGTPAASSER